MMAIFFCIEDWLLRLKCIFFAASSGVFYVINVIRNINCTMHDEIQRNIVKCLRYYGLEGLDYGSKGKTYGYVLLLWLSLSQPPAH